MNPHPRERLTLSRDLRVVSTNLTLRLVESLELTDLPLGQKHWIFVKNTETI